MRSIVAFSIVVRRFWVAGVALSFLAATVSFATDWPQYQRNPQHTGLSNAQIDVPNLTIAWTAPDGFTSPLVVGDTVYATKGSQFVSGTVYLNVSAFDLRTGAIRWSYQGTFRAASRAGVGAGFVVFAGSPMNSNPADPGFVYVLNASSGALLYTVPISIDLFQPLMPTIVEDADTGTVIAYFVDHSYVFAVSLGAASGSLIWTQAALIGGSGMPTLVENSLIVTGPGQYYAFDRLTGATNHFYTSNTIGGGGATVAYDASRHQFYVVDLYGDEGIHTLSAYHYTDNAHIDLLWQRSGEGVWGDAGVALGPSGHVYVAGLPEMIEVDPDSGVILGRIFADFAAGMTPAISNGVLWAYSYWQTGPRRTYAFNLETRQLIRTLPGSRGSLNTAYDGPGAICDNHFLLDLGTDLVVYAAPGPVHLGSAVSRMSHSPAGAFDVNLPLTGSAGVECRNGGPDGNFTLIFTFTNGLSSVGAATVASGTGSITSSGIDPADSHNYIVNLTGVLNGQTITIALTNVTDVQGGSSAELSVSMGVLLGDTNGDSCVNAGDICQTRSETGSFVTTANFREDVNTSGFINASDISLVKSQSGTALPP